MGFFDSFKKSSTIYDLLMQIKRENGSELRIAPGVPPETLVNGRLHPLSEKRLGSEEARDLCCKLFTDTQKAEFSKNKKIEFIFGVKGIGRINANIASADGKVSGMFTLLDQSGSK